MDNSLVGSLGEATTGLWVSMASFVPQLVIALLVLIAGWIVGGIISRVVQKGFKMLHLDTALDKAGVDELSEKAGYKFKPAKFVGTIVKWFIIIAFAIVAFDILNLGAVTDFMTNAVLGYLPHVFAAVLILFAAVLVASFARQTAVAVLKASGSTNVEMFGKLAYYLVIGFGIIALLNQLKIAEELMQTLFMGIIFALSLAAGLAFGLGGRDAASRFIDSLTKK